MKIASLQLFSGLVVLEYGTDEKLEVANHAFCVGIDLFFLREPAARLDAGRKNAQERPGASRTINPRKHGGTI